MSVTIEHVDPLQEQHVLLPFLKEHVNDRMTAEGYHWQFERIPEPALFIVGREDGAVVCTQSFLPHTLWHEGRPVRTTKSEHSFLIAAKRGSTVFTDAYAMGLGLADGMGASTCWGFTPAVKVWRQRLGFQVFDQDMVETISLLGPPRAEKPFSLRASYRFVRSSARHLLCLKPTTTTPASWTWSNELPTGEEMHELLSRAAGQPIIHLDMSDRFCTWRMAGNPNIAYRYHTLRDEAQRLVAFAIVGIDKRDPRTVHLSEAVATEQGTRQLLMAEIHRHYRGRGHVLRSFGNKHDPLFRQLWTSLSGTFASEMHVNAGMSFVLRTSLPNTGIERWHINALWTQGFHR